MSTLRTEGPNPDIEQLRREAEEQALEVVRDGEQRDKRLRFLHTLLTLTQHAGRNGVIDPDFALELSEYLSARSGGLLEKNQLRPSGTTPLRVSFDVIEAGSR